MYSKFVGFSFSWAKGVVEVEKAYYPGGFDDIVGEKRGRKDGREKDVHCTEWRRDLLRDYEWYENLKEGELKDESLNSKAIVEGSKRLAIILNRLKKEYDIWAMKMEHYLSHTDYPIWQVIQNGNGPVSITTDTHGMIKVLPPKTTEEVVARERERKARTTLLMALPEDHLAKFHKIADAKGMWEAIKSMFGGLDTLSFDDLYNNLRVFEHDVKGTTASSSNTQNVAFVSTENTCSTNDINDDDIEDMDLKWQVAMISMRIKKFYKRTRRKAKGNQDTTRRDTGYNGNKTRDNGRRPTYHDDSKALVTINREDIEWSGHSVFMNKESDLEDTSVNDRYANGMHAVPSPMTGNYMPSGPDVEIDYSNFTYDPKQTSFDESDSKPSEYVSCESDSSVETTTSMPKPVDNAPKDDPHKALKFKGIVDSRCSRHMTGNKAHLADYQELKGVSVAFGGSNERITGKGKIKTGRLDFEDVYSVEELKHYNLFSVSQMCDKYNGRCLLQI
nr:ribonuclease H-like domain-containing protein [Tanacetum cinerariifolium]